MSTALAFAIFMVLIGVAGVSYGIYAMTRGGRGQRGGIGPLSERGVHVIAGLRMLVVGVVALLVGGYVLWAYFS